MLSVDSRMVPLARLGALACFAFEFGVVKIELALIGISVPSPGVTSSKYGGRWAIARPASNTKGFYLLFNGT